MADSHVDFLTPTDNQQVFDNLTLDYVSTEDFYLTITSADGSTKTTYKTTDTSPKITVSTTPTLKITITDSAVYNSIDTDTPVRIGRITGISSPERTYSDGSTLKASDLNVSFKQVLFGIQEQVDGGLGSIPTDTDGKLDAAGKVIKNLGSPTNGNDAATKDYVLNAVTVGTGEPQSWSLNFNDQATSEAGDAWTISGNDLTRTLTSPTPTSANNNLYIIEIGGVLQDPDTAYTITESSGVYTLTVIGAHSDGLRGQNVTVNVRNWGVTRNELLQPFTQNTDAADQHALTLQNKTESSAGDLIRLLESDGTTTLGKVTEAGKLQVPEVSSLTGDLKVSSNIAVRNSTDDGDLFKVDQASGSTTVSSPATFSKVCTFSDVLNVTGSLKKNGAEVRGLKAIVDKTPDLGVTDSLTLPSTWCFIGVQLKLIKETANYSEGDYFIMTYSLPVLQNSTNEASLMNMVINTGHATAHQGEAWDTEEASKIGFDHPNMTVSQAPIKDAFKISNVKGQYSQGQNASHGHVGTVVYQISAEDAALSEINFDVIMVKYEGSPAVKHTYGTTFAGFLVG
jgi:hypothetical protein